MFLWPYFRFFSNLGCIRQLYKDYERPLKNLLFLGLFKFVQLFAEAS